MWCVMPDYTFGEVLQIRHATLAHAKLISQFTGDLERTVINYDYKYFVNSAVKATVFLETDIKPAQQYASIYLN